MNKNQWPKSGSNAGRIMAAAALAAVTMGDGYPYRCYVPTESCKATTITTFGRHSKRQMRRKAAK